MKNYKFLTFFVLICCSISLAGFVSVKPMPPQRLSLRKIIIDPGHGGADYGASGKYSHEKDVSLSIALKLQEVLKEQIPEVEIYMTRTTDVYDNVHVKANKANAAGGDLFISIHCNYVDGVRHSEIVGHTTKTVGKGKKKHTVKVPQYHYYTSPAVAKGTETYVWGIEKNGEKARALIENSWLYKDSTLNDDLSGFNPDDPEQIALISLKTQQYAERSRNLAATVEDEFIKVGRVSREAKQRFNKGIWVLQAVAMPAILVETGFISNPEEEDYINSKQGQKEIAECITRAVRRYKYSLDSKMQNNQSKPR